MVTSPPPALQHARDRLTHAPGEVLEGSSGSAAAISLCAAVLVFLQLPVLGDTSLLHCKSSSAEKTVRSQAILVSLMIFVKKGSSCCCIAFGLSPTKHLLSQKTKLQLSFNSEDQAQAFILHLVSSCSGCKKMLLAIKIRGSVTAFAAM